MAEKKEHQGAPVNQGFNFGEQTQIGDGATFYNNAGAQNVIINHFGGKKASTEEHRDEETTKRMDEELLARRELEVKETILQYVGKLIGFVDDFWKEKYLLLWQNILNIPAVRNIIYDPGIQRNTPFNRKALGNILYLLKNNGVFKPETSATSIASALEGNPNASIRINMGQKPDSNEISDNVKKLISNPEELGDETPPT